ncbi:putative NAD(P)H nitroreductase acg [Mycobacterium saskatchewanense]|uniref:NAD(P)H nitroreductase n=2 Tax=Mycobacterium saskatchewanense TaxID=220927 RepID=A0AAJ3TW74_9MYCO|nr:NAD(P)H nitroreductase [Mycobacterium saskatchewanense]BBX65821.1 putative NAD(P)H nitroreductase acg [Mycobacterium saskatchewanense]
MRENAPDVQVIREAVTLACHAPSLHNSQPWRWIAEGPALSLRADRYRLVYATDRAGRELTLSCGAVLDHLRVAMAAAGWDSVTHRLPDPKDPDHLASLRFSPLAEVTESHRRRAAAILRRHTDRLPYRAPAAWPALEAALRRAVAPYGISLDTVTDDARPALAEASRLTETLRRYDTSYQDELRWWTSPFSSDMGVPQSELVSSSESSRVDIGRAFPPAGGGGRHATVEHDQSQIVVLTTETDALLDVLRCGEALSAVLLECAVAGMATCTLTHMTEMAASRDVISEVTGNPGRPQLLIRIGTSPARDPHVGGTARRPVTEVLEIRQ